MEKVIALTGATGAMGGEVLSQLMLLPDDYKVRCIIYDAEKKLPEFFKSVVKKHKDRIETFRGDIACFDDCVKLVENASYIINCASVIPPKSDHNPNLAYLSNFLGTKNLVDATLKTDKSAYFVHIATVALYGNRSYPHIWGRVGDPIISSDYDSYSAYKLKAERYLLESGLENFVSLRQTGILHKYMFANNLKDGLMFHTPYNCVLEWVTDYDSGILIKNLVQKNERGELKDFWKAIYNIGGGEACRKTGFESLNDGFLLIGKNLKKLFKPNWNVTRNFHGVWFYDSDVLEEKLNFRTESAADYWTKMGKKYPYFKLAKIVPAPLLSKLVFKRLFKNTNAPKYWLKHNKEGRIKAFLGGRDKYEEIGENWDKFPLLNEGKTLSGEIDFEKLKDKQYIKEQGLLLNHGYDDTKPLDKITYEDLKSAAAFRGGKFLAESYGGNLFKKADWQCAEGHKFSLTPYTVLKGGYWCPHCSDPKPWNYGKLAKIPFYGQVYFDTHDESEINDVYPLSDDEDDFILER